MCYKMLTVWYSMIILPQVTLLEQMSSTNKIEQTSGSNQELITNTILREGKNFSSPVKSSSLFEKTETSIDTTKQSLPRRSADDDIISLLNKFETVTFKPVTGDEDVDISFMLQQTEKPRNIVQEDVDFSYLYTTKAIFQYYYPSPPIGGIPFYSNGQTFGRTRNQNDHTTVSFRPTQPKLQNQYENSPSPFYSNPQTKRINQYDNSPAPYYPNAPPKVANQYENSPVPYYLSNAPLKIENQYENSPILYYPNAPPKIENQYYINTPDPLYMLPKIRPLKQSTQEKYIFEDASMPILYDTTRNPDDVTVIVRNEYGGAGDQTMSTLGKLVEKLDDDDDFLPPGPDNNNCDGVAKCVTVNH